MMLKWNESNEKGIHTDVAATAAASDAASR